MFSLFWATWTTAEQALSCLFVSRWFTARWAISRVLIYYYHSSANQLHSGVAKGSGEIACFSYLPSKGGKQCFWAPHGKMERSLFLSFSLQPKTTAWGREREGKSAGSHTPQLNMLHLLKSGGLHVSKGDQKNLTSSWSAWSLMIHHHLKTANFPQHKIKNWIPTDPSSAGIQFRWLQVACCCDFTLEQTANRWTTCQLIDCLITIDEQKVSQAGRSSSIPTSNIIPGKSEGAFC